MKKEEKRCRFSFIEDIIDWFIQEAQIIYHKWNYFYYYYLRWINCNVFFKTDLNCFDNSVVVNIKF